MTINDLLDHLASDGLFDPARKDAAARALAGNAAPSHWAVRSLVGCSAWIAALILLFFFVQTNFITTNAAFFVAGLALLALATGGRRRAGDSSFIKQFALAGNFTGQLLVIYAVGDGTKESGAVALAVLLLQSALLLAYPDRIQQFMAAPAVVAALVVWMYDDRLKHLSHVICLVLSAATFLLWDSESRLRSIAVVGRFLDPFRLGVAVSLPALLILSVLPEDLGRVTSAWWPSTLILFAVLIGAVLRTVRTTRTPPSPPGLLLGGVAALTVCLLTRQFPGIAASLLLVVIAFGRSDRILLTIGFLSFAGFLGAYYYSLAMTLLAKSGIMILSGSILLALRPVLRLFDTPMPAEAPHA